jgi:hypothetical protein
MIRALFKVGFFLFLLAGWVVAAASLHVVRSPGDVPYVGKVSVVPKTTLTFKDTYVDTTKWTAGDLASHSGIYQRLPASVRTALEKSLVPAVSQAN